MINNLTHKILIKAGSLFSVLAMIMCLTVISMAQSILKADAYTSSVPKDLDSNFGTNPNLTISSTNNVYLYFQLPPTLPPTTQGSDVAKTTLKLYVGNVSAPGTIDVYEAGSSWSEKTITANNAPALGALISGGVQVDSNYKGQFLIIDITTTGRKTGEVRRIEIWFHNLDGRLFITGTPGKRSWYANLVAHPEFTFHLKEGVTADLPAHATPADGKRRRPSRTDRARHWR